MRFILLFVSVWTPGVGGQPRAEFEVVSIKPYVSQGNPANERSALDFPPGGRFSATNVSVRKLIRVAFGVEERANSRRTGMGGYAHLQHRGQNGGRR